MKIFLSDFIWIYNVTMEQIKINNNNITFNGVAQICNTTIKSNSTMYLCTLYINGILTILISILFNFYI